MNTPTPAETPTKTTGGLLAMSGPIEEVAETPQEPTPRTDKAQKECGEINMGNTEPYQVWYGYMSEHARTLERELTAAQSRIEGLEKINNEYLRLSAGIEDKMNDLRSGLAAERTASVTADARLSYLLARVHRDGGHYLAAYGIEHACNAADEKIAKLNAWSDTDLPKECDALLSRAETAEAELTTLREKLAESEAGAASMREALIALRHDATLADLTQSVSSASVNPSFVIKTVSDALSTTTGKATLAEIERLRAEVEKLRASHQDLYRMYDGFEKAIERWKAERDTALARMKALPSTAPIERKPKFKVGDRVKIIEAPDGTSDMVTEIQCGLYALAGGGWWRQEQLEPAPTKPEKAGSVAEYDGAKELAAFADGKTIQYDYGHGWEDWTPTAPPAFPNSWEWRIKPTETPPAVTGAKEEAQDFTREQLGV